MNQSLCLYPYQYLYYFLLPWARLKPKIAVHVTSPSWVHHFLSFWTHLPSEEPTARLFNRSPECWLFDTLIPWCRIYFPTLPFRKGHAKGLSRQGIKRRYVKKFSSVRAMILFLYLNSPHPKFTGIVFEGEIKECEFFCFLLTSHGRPRWMIFNAQKKAVASEVLLLCYCNLFDFLIHFSFHFILFSVFIVTALHFWFIKTYSINTSLVKNYRGTIKLQS